MTDLVERLRDPVWQQEYNAALPTMREAADEIERLRKECFALAADQCHDGVAGEHGDHVCREIERLEANLAEYENVPVRLRHIMKTGTMPPDDMK